MKKETTSTTEYIPNKQLTMGIKIWQMMVLDLVTNRELVWRFFLRDLSARYRQSVLGYIWAILMPFITIGAFIFLRKTGIVTIGPTTVPYPLFALIGVSVFQLFSTGIVSGTSSLVSAGSMIVKINFPREALVFASLAQALFDFLIKCVLIVIFCVIFKFIPSWTVLFFPLAIIPLALLTIGCSLAFSLINGIFRDTGNIISLFSMVLLFVTPVLYPAVPSKSIYFTLNPLTALVNAPRDLIIHGKIQDPILFSAAALFSLLVFLVFWRLFYLAETKIPERI